MNHLVTGCSRGVGVEICRVLLKQGHTVYGVARSYTDEFKALESEYAGRVFFKSIDLSMRFATCYFITPRDVSFTFRLSLLIPAIKA